MTNHETDTFELITRLLALASRLEGEGHYNIAKLARAASESLLRQIAQPAGALIAPEDLAEETLRIAQQLKSFRYGEGLSAADTQRCFSCPCLHGRGET